MGCVTCEGRDVGLVGGDGLSGSIQTQGAVNLRHRERVRGREVVGREFLVTNAVG
jgi:hypothetical protein